MNLTSSPPVCSAIAFMAMGMRCESYCFLELSNSIIVYYDNILGELNNRLTIILIISRFNFSIYS